MKTMRTFLLSFLTLAVLATASLSYAQLPPVNTVPKTATPSATSSTPCTPAPCPPSATSQALNIHISNPLKVSTITDAINLFMSVIIRIALPLIVIFFIWSGLSFIFARGNPTKIAEARRMFFFTIIGTLLILGAWVITNAIIGTVNAIIS